MLLFYIYKPIKNIEYIGKDIIKKTIAYCKMLTYQLIYKLK